LYILLPINHFHPWIHSLSSCHSLENAVQVNRMDATLKEWRSIPNAIRSLFPYDINIHLYAHSILLVWTNCIVFSNSMPYKWFTTFLQCLLHKQKHRWALLHLTYLSNTKIHTWIGPTFFIVCPNTVTINVELHHFYKHKIFMKIT